ncbi:MAG: hypothetical protein HY048_18165 [Acidobacteria bacterium]|nr:hypothetical protein [Acidobacteriota bacterium]
MRTDIIGRGQSRVALVASGVALAMIGAVLARAAFWHSLAEVAPINAGDFLISYAGGFVRRGLLGEMLYRLPFVTDMRRAEIAIKALSLVAYGASFALFASTVARSTRSLAITVLIALQPFLFGFPVLTGQWIKADLLLLLGFYVCLRSLNAMSGWRLLAINLVSIAAIATHETYGLTMLPLLIAVAASKNDPARRPWTRALPKAVAVFAPAVAALGVVSAFRGDARVARGIQDAWAARGIVLREDITPALFGLTHHNVWRMGFDIVFDNYSDKPFFFLFWGGVIVGSGALVSLAAGLCVVRDAREGPPVPFDWHGACETAAVVGLTAVVFAPLFLMATDFGRWIFLWLAVAAVIAFSPARHDFVDFAGRALPRAVSTPLRGASLRVQRWGAARLTSRSWCIGILACSLFCVPLPAYVMEGCCSVRYVMGFSLAAGVVGLMLGQ